MISNLINKHNDMSSTSAPAAKRQRSGEGSDLFQTLAQTLHEMRLTVLARDPSLQSISKLEVEMRVGMLVDGSRRWKSHQSSGGALIAKNERGLTFKSGIDEVIADRLKGILTKKDYTETNLTPERVRFNDSGDVRGIVDDSGNICGGTEAKDKFLRCDLACLGHNYDLRLDVASETPLDHSKVMAAVPKWHIQRLKHRTRYSHSKRCWQVDMTRVETTHLSGSAASRAPVTSIELEFEMLPHILSTWLRCAEPHDYNNLTSRIATELFEVFNLCVPSGCSDGQNSGIQSVLTPTSDILSALFSITSRIRAANTFNDRISGGSDRLDFLGSMPLNISRRNLKTLQSNNYFVTEKSDGVRYLMFVLPISAAPSLAAANFADSPSPAVAVLMDRSPKLYLPDGAAEIGRALGIGTVLDGEVVFNLSSKKSVFLMFDVLAIDGSPCSQWNFEQRLECLRGALSQRITALTSSQSQTKHQNQHHPTPLRVIEKKFVVKSDLQRLLDMMHDEGGHRIYADPKNPWRHHKSDGLIFQPNLPYLFSTDINLIKWKWPELTSIDLNAILVNDQGAPSVGLLAGASDGTVVDCTMRGKSRVAMGTFDTLRLRADIEDSVNRAAIAEVAYCPAYGLWTYFHLRADKSTPNFINTALSILMEQAESISIEELEYRLLARNESEDDFSKRHSIMIAEALQMQRDRCRDSARTVPPAGAAPAPAPAVACPWKKHRSRQYDRDYWVNEETGERVWEEPAAYRKANEQSTPLGLGHATSTQAPAATSTTAPQPSINYDEAIARERALYAYNAPSCPREINSVDIPSLVSRLRRECAAVISDPAKIGEHRAVFSLPDEDTSHITRYEFRCRGDDKKCVVMLGSCGGILFVGICCGRFMPKLYILYVLYCIRFHLWPIFVFYAGPSKKIRYLKFDSNSNDRGK